jgi:hypothetical protein
MPPKAKLRAVTEGESPARKRAATVSAAAEGGDRRELLVALRSRIAKSVEDPNTAARDLAALSRRLLEIAKDIEALDAAEDDESGTTATPDEEWDESAI